MLKQILIDRLIELPEEIEKAEHKVITAQHLVEIAVNQLKDKEAALINSPDKPINGKNAEERAAQLREMTATERILVTDAEKYSDEARVELNKLSNEFRAVRAVAQLLGGEVA